MLQKTLAFYVMALLICAGVGILGALSGVYFGYVSWQSLRHTLENTQINPPISIRDRKLGDVCEELSAFITSQGNARVRFLYVPEALRMATPRVSTKLDGNAFIALSAIKSSYDCKIELGKSFIIVTPAADSGHQ